MSKSTVEDRHLERPVRRVVAVAGADRTGRGERRVRPVRVVGGRDRLPGLVRRGGARPRSAGVDRRQREPVGVVGRPRRRRRRRDREPPRLGPTRRWLRRSTGDCLGTPRRRPAAGAARLAGPPAGDRRVRRGGGLPVRRRVPRLPPAHGRHRCRPGAVAHRPVRPDAQPRDGGRRQRPHPSRRRPGAGGPDRPVRRAAHRAGSRAPRPGRPGRSRERHLAPRPVATGLLG